MDRYIEKFIRYLEIEKNYSKYTIGNYKLDLEGFYKFLGDSPLEKVDYLVLRKYLAILKGKNFKNRTVGRHLSTLRSFFKFLVREGLLKIIPYPESPAPSRRNTCLYFLRRQR